MRPVVVVSALIFTSLAGSSCSSPEGGPLGFVMFDKNHHLASAEPLFSVDEDQCITAGFLLSVFSGQAPSGKEKPVCTQLRDQIRNAVPLGNLYDTAALTFGKTKAKPGDPIGNIYDTRAMLPEQRTAQRNEVIATLIFASNKRCGDYVHFLQTYQGNVRMGSGLASQAFATLATLATGNTAQWLAAGSSFATASGSITYNVHFADKTVAMLTQAFDNARLERVQAIEDRLQCSEALYPLPQAMADVFDYHTSCSLTTGLMQAQDAVNQQRSPDLTTLVKFADQIDTARAALLKLGGKSGASTGNSSGDSSGGDSSKGDPGSGGTPTTGSGGSTTPTTGTGGQAQPPQTHVPTCPFSVAHKQTAPKKSGKAKPKPKAGAKSKKGPPKPSSTAARNAPAKKK